MKYIYSIATASALALLPQVVAAQVSGNNAQSKNDESVIVVTATKRTTNLQDTPIAIGIVTGEEIREKHIAGLGDIAKYALSFQVGDNSVVPSAVVLTIRGLQSNTLIPSGDPSAAPHVDGIYTSRGSPRSGIFDVERVEILRGPQGTLFGRNSTSGAINIVTAKPEFDTTGYISAGYGNYNFYEVLGAVSVPLSDKLSVRAAGFHRAHDGYQKNLNAGQPDMADDDSVGGRLSLRWEPSDNLKINASIDRVEVSGAGANYQLLNANGLRLDAHEADTDTPHMLRYNGGGERLEIVYSFPGVDLVGMFGHRYVNDFSQVDVDGTTNSQNRAQFTNKQRSFFQEIRVQSSGSNDLSWTLGGNYYDDKLFTDRPFTVDLGAPELEIRAIYPGNTTKSYAVFGNADFKITPEITLTGGVRYTKDKKNFPNATVNTTFVTPTGVRLPPTIRSVANNVSFSKVTWTAGVNYEPTNDVMIYAKAASGYKAGGSEQGITYRPETVMGYEAGIKSSIFDRILTLNVAAFYNEYKDLQIAKTVNALTLVDNAATATIKGLEVEAVLSPGEGFKFNAGISLMQAKYGAYADATDPRNPLTTAQRNAGLRGPDLSGNYLPAAPKLDMVFSMEKEIAVGGAILTPSFNLRYRSRYWGTEFNDFNDYGVLGQKAHLRLDANLKLASGQGWSANIYGQNLTNEDIQTFSAVGGNGSLIASYGNPRTYGVNLSFDF